MTRLDTHFAIVTTTIAIGCAAALLWADIASPIRDGVAAAGAMNAIAAICTFFDWSPPRGQR